MDKKRKKSVTDFTAAAEGVVSRLAAKPTDLLGKGAAAAGGLEEELRATISALYRLSTKLSLSATIKGAPQELRTIRTPHEAKVAARQVAKTGSSAGPTATEARLVPVEHIWGRMSLLAAPLTRSAEEVVDAAADRLAGAPAAAHASAVPKQFPAIKQPAEEEEVEEDEEGEEGEEFSEESEEDDGSFLEEDEEGEAIEAIAAKVAGGRDLLGKKKGAEKAAEGDEWRYAFGKGVEDDLPEEDEEEGEGRMRKKQRKGEEEEGLDDDGGFEEDEEGEEEDKAALAELYGDDGIDEDDVPFDALMGGKQLDDGAEEDLADEEVEDDIMSAIGEEGEEEEGEGGRGAAEGQKGEVDEDDEAIDNDPTLTAFEKKQLKEQRRIDLMERQRLYGGGEQGWTMAGEVSGAKRPRDSLLDTTIDFDHGTRAVPVISTAQTQKLEDRIKRRILAGNYDDVVRRVARTTAADLVQVKRGDAALESEKSRRSLMDLYEKEYVDKMRAAEEAAGQEQQQHAEALTEIEKDELRAIQMWKRLSQHLDALSNYFFTPKPVQADLDARVRAVEHAAPAVSLEGVGNAAPVSKEGALAPQDLYRPNPTLRLQGVSAEEMVPQERRALRKAKKEHSKATAARREKQKKMLDDRNKQKKAKQQQSQEVAAK